MEGAGILPADDKLQPLQKTGNLCYNVIKFSYSHFGPRPQSLRLSRVKTCFPSALGSIIYQGIVKRRIIEIVRLQIDSVILEVNKHIESFEEIIADHAVYILFTQHP